MKKYIILFFFTLVLCIIITRGGGGGGGRIYVQNIEYPLTLFGSCRVEFLFFVDDFDFNHIIIQLPIKIKKSRRNYDTHGPSSSFSTMDKLAVCKVYFIFLSEEMQLMEESNFIINSLKWLMMDTVTVKSGNGGQQKYSKRYGGVYFAIFGNNSSAFSSSLMSQLMREEFPNHWFYFNMNSSSNISPSSVGFDSEKVVRIKSVEYLCLRCIQPFVPNSDFEFDLWKWKTVPTLPTKPFLNEFIQKEEVGIGMLLWWDYYHLPIWRAHISEVLSFGIRGLLKQVRKNSYQIVSSDFLFSLALGDNKSLEYSKFHSFYRQSQKEVLQGLQIMGVPYLTQDEDAHPTGMTGMWLNNYQVFPVEGNDFKFITCSPVSESQFSFYFYLQPFGFFIWILLLILLLVQPILILGGLSSNIRKKYFVYVFFFFSVTLFEVPSSIPNRMGKIRPFALLYLSWSIISVIFSNGYKGVLTNYMIAPLKDNTPQSWTELSNLKSFTLLMAEGNIPPSSEYSEKYGVLTAPISRLAKDAFIKMREKADKLIQVNKNLTKKEAMDIVFESTTYGRLYGRIDTTNNFDYKQIESVLSNCQKSVLVESGKIFEIYLKNIFPRRSSKVNKFYRMSEDSFKGSSGWISGSKFGNPQILSRLSSIIESGLFKACKDIIQFGLIFRNINFDSITQFEPQKLVSNISTVFILFSTLCVLCFLVFILEILTYYNRIHRASSISNLETFPKPKQNPRNRIKPYLTISPK